MFKKIFSSKKIILIFSIILPIFILTTTGAEAATLQFSPASGNYNTGATFSVGILVSSPTQAMNAASGAISFPTDKLEVVSISKAGSIFNLWVQEPTFSNTAGTINFEGIIFTPGFTGNNGRLLTINFRTKSPGIATLRMISGSVLANDGQGTNILTAMSNASFNIVPLERIEPEETPVSSVTSLKIDINSPTHPNPEKWYSSNKVIFNWQLASDITSIRTLLSRSAEAVPSVTYTPPISSKELENIADGIWYFALRGQNDAGWGEISRFKIQIDTAKPQELIIKEIEREDLTDPRVKFVFEAKDKTSGISHYEVKINDSKWQRLKEGQSEYENIFSPGRKKITVSVFDKAGNYLENSREFMVRPLETPIITDWPDRLLTNEQLVVEGITRYKNSDIVIELQREGRNARSFTIKSDNNGNFTFQSEERLGPGIYELWAKVVDSREAMSLSTDKITISVKNPSIFSLEPWVKNLLFKGIIPILILLAIIWIITKYIRYKLLVPKIKIKKEVEEAEDALKKAFVLLKKEIDKNFKKIKKKKDITKKDLEILEQIKRDLEDSEKFIEKEIKDIEKEI
ncbi:MAG TPA: hypothetical protein ENN31_00950 [Candidatus Vogelbacteria bacterium]|nr:hypothetical protein [Candidatus Vogelbacteria bacterium]